MVSRYGGVLVSVARLLVVATVVLLLRLHGFGSGPRRFPLRTAPGGDCRPHVSACLCLWLCPGLCPPTVRLADNLPRQGSWCHCSCHCWPACAAYDLLLGSWAVRLLDFHVTAEALSIAWHCNHQRAVRVMSLQVCMAVEIAWMYMSHGPGPDTSSK